MELKIVAIRDRTADVFGLPQFVPTLGHAIRGFGDEVNRSAPDNPLYNHPGDFDLYHLGTYNDENASFNLLEQPKQLAIGKEASQRTFKHTD